VRQLSESLGTDLTPEWPFTGMSSQVYLYSQSTGKYFKYDNLTYGCVNDVLTSIYQVFSGTKRCKKFAKYGESE